MAFAAGALASTLADLHAWGIALGAGFGLTPELQRARIDEQLGVFVRREETSGRVISFGHAGSEPGYGANVDYYPCTGAVVALMVNGDGGTGEAVIAMIKALDPTIKPIVDPPGKCSAKGN
jgi:D-alanyl-D-alanine carboxypeptidase